MKRGIIDIDQAKCNGCGQCISNCPEGAIQLIDGKARLVGDLLCDGLGACIGYCPQDAIKIEQREAEPYDELKVIENIVKQGANVIKAHLVHLRDHRQMENLNQALAYLDKKEIPNPLNDQSTATAHTGCPGARSMNFHKHASSPAKSQPHTPAESQLTHWPIQLHLISPMAPQYKNADVLISADCVAYALADFHAKLLANKSLAIACPKLDNDQNIYLAKIISLIDDAHINTLTVIVMEVPCCHGLLSIAKQAAAQAKRKAPIKAIVVGIQGKLLSEEWV